jgi:predicted ATPase
MLREMADALAVLTAERGLVWALEDLHASDRSTVELLAYLAQRRERARLLIVGTYRPATVVAKEHPLRGIVQELRVHEQCQELRLELLTQADVAKYLAQRLVTGLVPGAVAEQMHRRTDGNALFLVTVVEYLLRQGLLSQVKGQWQLQRPLETAGIPESLRQIIEQQIAQVGAEEHQVLVAASVQGYEFDSAVVASAAGNGAAKSRPILIFPLRRPGCRTTSRKGTSLARGFPLLAITISSPAATRSRSRESCVFA